MNKELKDKWIAALRSGEYKQGIAELYNSDNATYCCLGVLNAVAGRALCDLEVYRIDKSTELWQLNDGAGRNKQHSFTEIADWIEENIDAE